MYRTGKAIHVSIDMYGFVYIISLPYGDEAFVKGVSIISLCLYYTVL